MKISKAFTQNLETLQKVENLKNVGPFLSHKTDRDVIFRHLFNKAVCRFRYKSFLDLSIGISLFNHLLTII